MLTKLATFSGVSDEGEPLVRLFRQGDNIQKVAGQMMPEVQDWLGGYTTDLKKIAILVNALGGSEYWGQNSNGDVFPWQALRYDLRGHPAQWPVDDFTGRGIPPYGYRTFLDAHPFMHHRNKDPARAFGNVAISCLNSKMKRVELVVLLDRYQAGKCDADHVLRRIDAGEYPDVSMGCRVPYDVCTICGHKSRTRNDYCACIRDLGMGRLLDDGRRVGVINLYPRFFDISFVFIGADKTAKMMAKLASGIWMPESILDADHLYGQGNEEEEGLLKAAAHKPSSNIFYMSHDLEKPGEKRSSERLLDYRGQPATMGEIASHLADQVISAANEFRTKVAFEGNPAATTPVEEANTMLDHPTEEQAIDRILKHEPHTLPFELRRRMQQVTMDKGPASFGPQDTFLRTNAGDGNETSEYVEKEGAAERIRKMMERRDPDQESKNPRDIDNWKFLEGIPHSDEPTETKMPGTKSSFVTFDQLREAAREGREKTGEMTRVILKMAECKKEKCECKDGGRIGAPDGCPCEPPTGVVDRLPHLQTMPGVPQNDKDGVSEGSGGTGDEGLVGGVNTVQAKPAAMKIAEKLKSASKKLQAPPHRDEFPYQGKYKWRGLTILIENAKDTWRVGKGWKTKMKYDYGEVEGSLGSDGDPVDVYVGPHEKVPNVYIVHQNHVFGPKKGQYDEDKVMLGFRTAREARKAYLAHYDSGDFFRSITEMPFETFKKLIFKSEGQGEKLATLKDQIKEALAKKQAGKDELADLFFHGPQASRRMRVWKDMETGAQTEHVGSGLGGSFDTLQKTAETFTHRSRCEVAHPDSTHDEWLVSSGPEDTKSASHAKVADIDKEVEPSGTVGRVSAALTEREPKLPNPVLDAMARCSLQEALATPSMMGMALKPGEFQRLLLSHIGKSDVADQLEGEGKTFSGSCGCEAPCPDLGPKDFSSSIMKKLLPFLEDRSYLSPVIVRRVTRISMMRPRREGSLAGGESPLLTKIGHAYNWYRQEMAKIAAAHSSHALRSHPELVAQVYGLDDAGMFFQKEATGESAALATVPLSLMYSSTIRGDMEQGRDPDFLQQLVDDHPNLSKFGTAALAQHVKRAQAVKAAVERTTGGTV